MKRSEAAWWLFAAGVELRSDEGMRLALWMLKAGPERVHQMATACAWLHAHHCEQARDVRLINIIARRLCRLVEAP